MNKEKMNNILWIVSVIIVIVMGVYLVKTQHSKPENMTQLRWSTDANPMRQVVISEFEKIHPNIHVYTDPNAGMDALLTQLAGDVPPDIMSLYDIESFRRMARLEQLVDLTPYLKKYNISADKFRPEIYDYIYPSKDDKRVLGVTENCGPLCLMYNKDIFDKYNVPYPTNDMTWDQVVETAKKLTKYKTINGRQVPDIKGLYVYEDPQIYARMYGGSLFSSDGKKCVINSPEAVKGLTFFSDLRLKHRVMPTSSEAESMASMGGWSASNQLMIQGKIAMLIGGRFAVVQLRDYYSKGLRLGMARFPRSPYPCNLLLSKCYTVPKGSRHIEEAAEFLAFLLQNDNQKRILDYGDGWSAVKNPELDAYAAFNPKYPNEDQNAELLKDFENSRLPEISPYINYVDYWSIWQREVDKVWFGEKTMQQCCDTVAKDVNKIIERNIANPNFLN